MDVVHTAQRVWVGCMTSKEVQDKQELRPLSGQLWERCQGSAQPLSSQGRTLSSMAPLLSRGSTSGRRARCPRGSPPQWRPFGWTEAGEDAAR